MSLNYPKQIDDKELVSRKGETIILDIECYDNYFLIMFMFFDGQVVYFEGTDINIKKLTWILTNFEIVTFNGIHYDLPILRYFIHCSPSLSNLFYAGGLLIGGMSFYEFHHKYNIPHRAIKINHIDIKEICIGQSSLKTYAGRIHADYMQDLPYEPYTILTKVQKLKVLLYCINDCKNTLKVYMDRKKDIDLRRELSIQYSSDVRSKSDAQIAEVVISRELQWKHGVTVSKTSRPDGHTWKYSAPKNIAFRTPELQEMYQRVLSTTFVLTDTGSIQFSGGLEEYSKTTWINGVRDRWLEFRGTRYAMGIGGLHSKEENVTHETDDEFIFIDRDVASYYPFIILNQQLYPLHLGRNFLPVYEGIVRRRLVAKASGDKRTANTLKIVINGSFGKFGSQYSFLFSPELLIQTTVSGQLYLMMLIERLELNGFHVVSANTDGIVTKVDRKRRDLFEKIVAWWERITNFETEETEYAKLCSRDVNNYIAVKMDGEVKSKGAYAEANIGKNPAGEISNDAVRKFLSEGIPLEETINGCSDMSKFVFVRKVNGGCVTQDKEEIGKVIRFYYQKGNFFPLRYKTNGHKVPKTDGATPFMDFTVDFPQDIDYNRYLAEAKRILAKDFTSVKQLGLFD